MNVSTPKPRRVRVRRGSLDLTRDQRLVLRELARRPATPLAMSDALGTPHAARRVAHQLRRRGLVAYDGCDEFAITERGRAALAAGAEAKSGGSR